jgi:hypothetical protein
MVALNSGCHPHTQFGSTLLRVRGRPLRPTKVESAVRGGAEALCESRGNRAPPVAEKPGVALQILDAVPMLL